MKVSVQSCPSPSRLVALLAAVATAGALAPAPAFANEPSDDGTSDAQVLDPLAEALGLDQPDRQPIPGAAPGADVPIAPPAPTAPEVAPPAAETDDDAATASPEVFTADAGFPVRSNVADTGEVEPAILMHGRGWGHSVGLSQYGAFAKALEGDSANDILTHYYPGTSVTTDTRSSDDRIRVGIQVTASSSSATALDGSVPWRVCTPASSPASNGRVPSERCADWFTQARDETLRVRPLPADGVATPNPTMTHDGGDVTALTEAGPAGEAVAAPRGGLLIERRVGAGDSATWEPQRAFVTPAGTSSSQLPVARIDHGSQRIQATSYANPERVYAYGWRDVHLVAPAATDVSNHRLTVAQDVTSVERYLRGLAEVPSSWPSASLDAQAIAGRTYALRGSRGGGCLCDRLATASDQVFIGESKAEEPTYGVRWVAAVEATKDQVLTFDGRLAETFYSSSFGGRSENVEDSWAYYRGWQNLSDPNRQPPAYLRSVDDPWSLMGEVDGTTIPNNRRSWEAAASNEAFTDLVNRERDRAGEPRFDRIERVRVGERTEGGTPSTLRLTGALSDGTRASYTYRGDTRLSRPIAGAMIRTDLPLVGGGESNGRVSSSQIRRFGIGPFDDDDGSTHEYAITWAATAGIVQGVDEGRFAPDRDVTRAQMATFLNNTFRLPSPDAGAETFPDVRPGSTHHQAIEAIAAVGITEGYGDGTYRPGDPVSRQEMATFLTRAQALTASGDGRVFDDVDPASTHGPSIAAVAEVGITAGCTEDRYCPRDPVSRGQMASFVHRSVQR